ncbi:uncharacterized protein LOC130917881 [Corythoichthys intestinalis]|uniref:uncharacterized protein LOC130917881 n=1 Tax=Corythoichthys intestinalis TaxID=161448 RepID=UPI0025A67D29|nr:uncharacterized protein LOC130917881 [Corythoichthys intestinalis]XP_057695610.1 uncharacterized protein LOC130917881 [Corythoichthys intestinalis]
MSCSTAFMSVNLMSNNEISYVEFLHECEGRFYFQVLVDETDGNLRTDCFKKSSKCLTSLIQVQNQYLLLKDDNQFGIQTLTIAQQDSPNCKFRIHYYNESDKKKRKGRPVMLYVKKSNCIAVVCCRNAQEIYTKEKTALPENIDEDIDEALFYMSQLPDKTNTYMLESCLYHSNFLGFKPLKDNPCKLTLALYRKVDEVDESVEVTLLRK